LGEAGSESEESDEGDGESDNEGNGSECESDGVISTAETPHARGEKSLHLDEVENNSAEVICAMACVLDQLSIKNQSNIESTIVSGEDSGETSDSQFVGSAVPSIHIFDYCNRSTYECLYVCVCVGEEEACALVLLLFV
jgi:hypothetical protein